MEKATNVSEMANHKALDGLIFKRKMMNPNRLNGLGYFAASFGIWAYFPQVALTLGSNFASFAFVGTALRGAWFTTEQDIVNSIGIAGEGEHEGLLEINVSMSPITSKTIYVPIDNVHAVFSMSNDDMGEQDVENNVLELNDFIDGGNTVAAGQFVLPADSWRDNSMLSWILSNKSGVESLETTNLYNDLLSQ